ncbi:argininosuccinate lyase [Treponema primitia ZAS-2]|uniref:Argininosuccinate lyase n=1 Tax=Treponema primitia (strain ATCC BAA-887 / DSM 12427 / ZAS-2) TaxID=545694 RepID=F5YK60_TREPZ|nr:argininosuccinate lyase [Treponema primitia]AEF84259.1 argininosuccinate lyase [Treponema primitia ZAS-2]
MKDQDNKPTPQVLWAGRLAEKPEAEAFAFQASISVDQRLAQDDILGSRAHAAMLGKQGIIPPETATALDTELARIADELEAGKLAIDPGAEDIHSFIEGILTERLGDAGRMVHAGRSRNDQVALDFRLYLKRAVPELGAELTETIRALLDQAEQHTESIMPGYTHLQRAQPVTLGYQLSAWCAGLARDRSRFADALRRLDECPLGAGALAGSSLPLDREATAKALGFARPTLNAMDSVADRDFALELASACSITMIHLSRFCEDVVLWASEEFKFIDLAESWSTGSSIMPQKKNPDFAELIRGKSGRTTGNLVSLLTLLKGLPYAYDKDLQEDKEALFDSIDTVRSCLRMFRGMMASARFNKSRMEAACIGGFMEATDAAEYLVRKGLPFRKAHEVAALVVRDCVAAGLTRIADRSLAELKTRSELFEADIYQTITPAACVAARKLPGGPAPEEVRRQIRVLRGEIAG